MNAKGSQARPQVVTVTRTENPPAERKPNPRSQFRVLRHGRITTTVWANRTHWGDVEWRITQAREYPRQGGSGFSTNFGEEDVDDMINGLKTARKIIREARGELAWRRLFGWRW
ncbi:MAG: hypothetical protein U0790_02120 [Isosphaeraceae bacterium]